MRTSYRVVAVVNINSKYTINANLYCFQVLIFLLSLEFKLRLLKLFMKKINKTHARILLIYLNLFLCFYTIHL